MRLWAFLAASGLLAEAENFREKTSYKTEIPCSSCKCEEKCNSCGVCVNFILDTSCDSMSELRIMKDFVGNLVDEMILSEDRHRFHPFLIINSNGRNILDFHPSQTSSSLRLNEIKVAVNALRPAGSFSLNQAITASAELNGDLGDNCSSKINVIVSNGGVEKRLKTRVAETDTTYLLTLNNWACEKGQKEDCWNAEVVDQLRQHGATVLNLPIESHRDYVKTSIVQYIDACEEKCEEHCSCDCQLAVTNCAKDDAQKPCCGKRGEQGKEGRKGVRGARGVDGPKGEKGQKGSDGKAGEIGRKGPQGAQGLPNDIRGTVGIDGDDGQPGKRGEPGLPGYAGTVGEMGPVGHPGDEGDVGLAPPGPKGTKGMTGNKGERGRGGPLGPAGSGVGSSSFYDTYKNILKKSLLDSFRKGNVPNSISNKFKEIAEQKQREMCSCNCELNGRCDRISQPSYPQSKQEKHTVCIHSKSTVFENPAVRVLLTVAPTKEKKIYRQPTSNDVVPSKKPSPRKKFRRRRFRRKRYHH